jgi:hypothetical protein
MADAPAAYRQVEGPQGFTPQLPPDKSLGSSVPLDVLVGASRLLQFSAGHMVPPLEPIRPGIGPEVTALGAAHTRAEGRHRDIVRPEIDVDRGMVAAGAAGEVERADAVLAHVAESHRAD